MAHHKLFLDDPQNLHDETVALTLQLNVMEEQNSRLARDNKELIDRWMLKVGQEAEVLNRVSDFI